MILQSILLASSILWPAFTTPAVDQWIASINATRSSLLKYPTQFSQDIVPKPIHSHNDYWRDVPLFTALSFGVASVEADVWLINQTLFVGHELAALTENRTFASLYIEPLTKILASMNPKDAFTVNQTTPNGVFDTASNIPLQLLVDIKTDGTEALPFVLKALEPLRSAGYLTTFANGTLTQSVITVVGTGNSPLEGVKALEPRDYFFDAPLTQLNDTSLNTTWDATLSPLASTDYQVAVGWRGIGAISDAQRKKITDLVNDAQAKGIRARFWDTPGWPIHAREKVWKELLTDGVDWLNADDLEAASEF
ncbi:hypothetical protein EW146_g9557 [Bondarzewia mesenterica]|uniref:Altered inheritance of mitochondria protein 6 n=1 Tax=Bondarzewia mesenterica TaxID=1095465 RepID=A0A4S4L6M9_9AGAM|nr:hypothetical protein EW146_g9557 [Bondarzewia mesenterica]